MSRRTNESLLDHSSGARGEEVIEMPGCAPPVVAPEPEERRIDRAYTEAGAMSLRDYVEKWGSAL